MSVWYRTGTISVSNGSTSVTGSGTAWVGVVRKGDALVAPDGRSYEITSVNSNTSLTLGSAYQGSSASGSEYAVQPTRGIAREWFEAVSAFQAQISGWADGPLSGLFGNGSAGSPGVSFANQTNMGLYRASSSALAISVGGSERARFTTAGMQVTGQITGNAVTQSATDTTAGRLLKVGDHGLGESGADFGVTSEATGLEDIPATSFFMHSTGNAPGDAPFETQGAGIKIGGDGDSWNATFWGSLFSNRWFCRVAPSSGGLSQWAELYHTGNLVGTVSQSGGVPTGAVIERGSNSNGEYVRFADGTQISITDISVPDVSDASGDMFRSSQVEMTFPAEFVGGAYGGSVAAVGTSDVWGVFRPSSQSIGFIRLFAPTSRSSSTTTRVLVVGRWF